MDHQYTYEEVQEVAMDWLKNLGLIFIGIITGLGAGLAVWLIVRARRTNVDVQATEDIQAARLEQIHTWGENEKSKLDQASIDALVERTNERIKQRSNSQ